MGFNLSDPALQGYALVEFEKKEEAESAIRGLNDSEFMEKQLTASWAFVAPPSHTQTINHSRTSLGLALKRD